MNAINLYRLCDSLHVLALAIWLGAMIFAPSRVGIQGPGANSMAGEARRSLLSAYEWGVSAGALALAAFTSGVLVMPEFRGTLALAQITALLLGVMTMLYARNSGSLATRTSSSSTLHDQGDTGEGRSRPVALTRIVAVGIACLVVLHSWRPSPTTEGIVEPSVREQAQRSFEKAALMERDYLRSRGETSAPVRDERGSRTP